MPEQEQKLNREESWEERFEVEFDHYVNAIGKSEAKSFISHLLKTERERVKERVEKLAGQNTYEGEEALIYRTTMKEVLALLDSKEGEK